jgi:hypothetical protein
MSRQTRILTCRNTHKINLARKLGLVLGWLIQQALPEHVPAALRRARSSYFTDPDLQTTAELAARQALADLEARHAIEKLRLEEELRQAQEQAGTVRYGLLYGTGTQLVQAVAAVLDAAGLVTIDLDHDLGATRSADLLVSGGGPPRRLTEVKAASGAAPGNMASHLERHLGTWPQLRLGEPVTGGVLIVNHQHRLHPSERTEQVYSRPEFLAALRVTVLSTLDLFRWWRAENWTAIQTAVMGDAPDTAKLPQRQHSLDPAQPSQPAAMEATQQTQLTGIGQAKYQQ